jgi:hypothetical protein
MDITIAYMTNYTLDIPNIDKQKTTIESFYKVFKPDNMLKTIIYCDEKPLSKIEGTITLLDNTKYDDYTIVGKKYEENLLSIPLLQNAKFVKTNGLCDGYKRVIDSCETKYIFFLEHDWIFLDNIKHTLKQLIEIMDKNIDINNILFNKLDNTVKPFQKFYNSKNTGLNLLLTNRISNNPNILRTSHAKDIRYPLINNDGCSIHPGIEFYYNINEMKMPNYCGGIECELCEYCKEDETKVNTLGTYLYGSYRHPPTIIHSDGCNRQLLHTNGK